MSDSAVYVTFGGDASQLEASLAQSKALVQSYARELAALSRQQVATGASAESELGQKMLNVAAQLTQAKAQSRDVSGQLGRLAHGLEAAGQAAAHGHTGIGFYVREIHALFDELGSGRDRQAIGTLSNLIGTTLQSNLALIPYAAAIAAVAAAFAYLGYEAVSAANAIRALQLDAVVGGFQLTEAAAQQVIATIAQFANVSQRAAEEIFKPFAELGRGGEIVAQLIAPHLQTLADQMGKTLPEAAAEVAKRFQELEGAGRKYINSTDLATSAQRQQYDAFVRGGEVGKAWGVIVDVMAQQLTNYESKQKLANAAIKDSVPAYDGADGAASVFSLGLGAVGAATEKATADIANMDAKTRALRETLDSAAGSARTFAAGMATAMKVDKVANEIAETKGQIASLENALAAGPDKASPAMIELGRALDIARDKMKQLQQEAEAGVGGGNALSQMKQQFEIDDSGFKGADADRLREHQAAMEQLLASDKLTADQRKQLEVDLAQNERAIRDALNASYLRQDEAKVSAAGKNSAAIIAIRQAEVQRETAIYGQGSKEAEAAEDRLARAKEQAANRGATAATKAATEALAGEQESYAQQISNAEKAAQAKIKLYGLEAKAKQISEAEKLQLTLAALAEEKSATDKAYAAELALAGDNAKKLEELQGQLKTFNLENAFAILDAQEQAALKVGQAWTSAASQVEGAFNSQLRSLLSGQENFGTAMRKTLADLVLQMIEGFEKFAIQAVLQYAVINNAAGASAAVQTAANEAASAGGVGGLMANAAKAVIVDAGQTFAGVAAFLAPIMGPAALGPAAAAQATVMGVASADVGMWDVPADMLTLVHHNELIMPAAQGAAFRDLLSGSGRAGAGSQVSIAPTTHLHVNALDGASVGQWFRNNQREMMGAIDQAVRHGAHLGLRRLAAT